MAYYSKKVLPGEVRDEQGRRRLHGAFTGGWSAGFYNTVGSAEGWTPSTFVSSRDRQAQEQATVQRPEDFMDEEDGLLGHAVSTSSDYDTLGVAGKELLRRQAGFEAQGLGTRSESSGDASASSSGGVGGSVAPQARRGLIPGAAPLELMAVLGQPVGKRLLQTMGWREGTGVGARVAPGKRRKRSTTGASGANAAAEGATGVGGDGAVEAASRARTGGEEAVEEDSAWQHMPEGATVAPKDEDAVLEVPPPKSDLYGIGFDPMVENPELERARRQAFGHRGPGGGGGNGGASGRGSRTYAMGGGGAGDGARHAGQLDVGGFAVDDGDDDTYGSGPATFAAGDYDTEIGGDGDDDDDHQLPLRLMSSSSSSSGSGGLKSGGGGALGRDLNNNELLEAFGFAPPATSFRGGSGSGGDSAEAPCADGKPPLPGFALGGARAGHSGSRTSGSRSGGGGGGSSAAHGEKHWPPPVVPRGFRPSAHLRPAPKQSASSTAPPVPPAATAAAAMQPTATAAHEVAAALAPRPSLPRPQESAGRQSNSGSGPHGRLTSSDRSKLLGEESRTFQSPLSAAGAAVAGAVPSAGDAAPGTTATAEAAAATEAPPARPMLMGRGGGTFVGLASLGQAMSKRFSSTTEVLTADPHAGGLAPRAAVSAGGGGGGATVSEDAAQVAAARALLGGVSTANHATAIGSAATPLLPFKKGTSSPQAAAAAAASAAAAVVVMAPTVPLPPPKPFPVVAHRTTAEWPPERLLCQRFNVPPPANATNAAAAAAAAAKNAELVRQVHGKGGGKGGPTVVPTLSRDAYQEQVAPFLADLGVAATTAEGSMPLAEQPGAERSGGRGTGMPPPPPPRFAAQDLLVGLTDSPPPSGGVDRTPTPPPAAAPPAPSLDTEVSATKPSSVDFFKAIFEPSSEEEDSSEDEDDEEDEEDNKAGVGAQPSNTSVAQQPASSRSVVGPLHPFARLAADRQAPQQQPQQQQQQQPQHPVRGPMAPGNSSEPAHSSKERQRAVSSASAAMTALPEALSKETLLSLARNSSKVGSSSSSSSEDGSSDNSSDSGRKRKGRGKAKKKEKKRHKKRGKKQKKHKHKSEPR